MHSRTKIPPELGGSQIRTRARFNWARGSVWWNRQLLSPQTVPLKWLIHYFLTFTWASNLSDCSKGNKRLVSLTALLSICFKYAPPDMYPLHTAIRGDVHIIVFPELECTAWEWICKSSKTDMVFTSSLLLSEAITHKPLWQNNSLKFVFKCFPAAERGGRERSQY